jgi:group I intron endonuclease
MGIIYCYTNKNTGKKYIGQTIHPEQRKRNHLHEAIKKDSEYYFHRSIRKHGIDAFDYEVLEENVKNLNDRENHYINMYDTLWPNGYNQCPAAGLDKTAIEKMKETKRKQFAAMTEEERKELTRKMCEGNIGSKRSEETRKKQSAAAKRNIANNPDLVYNRTKRRDNTSGHKGVSLNKASGKWFAYITENKQHIHIGSYSNLEDAINARNEYMEAKKGTPKRPQFLDPNSYG